MYMKLLTDMVDLGLTMKLMSDNDLVLNMGLRTNMDVGLT